ncbi:MAG: hypothetical protein DRJ40_08835 [Thermoprotei archaeon]|nr:MAG: hypothetical protein DRJ40_08835 [Thermoprotei archaeon]
MERDIVIERYEFGHIVVNGISYIDDVVLLPSGDVIPRKKHRVKGRMWHRPLTGSELKEYLEMCRSDVDVVVVGTGFLGLMPLDEDAEALLNELRSRGIEVIVVNTRKAVSLLRDLVAEGRRILAVLHLTC